MLYCLIGLCRTAEIFGISQLVMGNLAIAKDKLFESLSVTSQKWMPMKEVKLLRCKYNNAVP